MGANEIKPWHEPVPDALEQVAHEVLNAAFRVHKNLGPGLLESVYETCLVYELKKAGLQGERQVSLPIRYDGVVLESSLRLDLLVEGSLIVELKTVEELQPVHMAQLLTYLRLSGHRLGLLINFYSALLKDGIKRVVV